MAATENNTLVRLDLDNDGDFDAVDTNGDGLINPGPPILCAMATPNYVYTDQFSGLAPRLRPQ